MEADESLLTFHFEGQPMRVIVSKTRQPKFVLEDVCKILGVTEDEARDVVEDVDLGSTPIPGVH